MTPGEKINYYRKQLGLSQEELGQKLLVSRQTISLWEKGQTVPTIDNLIRLKEIFGITVDELLGCAEEITDEVSSAKESYVFSYAKEEIKKIFGQSKKQLIFSIAFLTVFAVGFFVWMFFDTEERAGIGIVFGILIMSLIILIKSFLINSKNYKKLIERIPKSLYDVKAYDDCFTVKVSRDGEVKSDFKFDYNDIEQFLDYGDFLYIIANDIAVILRKSDLVQNSVFTLLSKSNPEKTVVSKKGMVITRVALNILFVLAIFSELVPMILVGLLPSAEELLVENQWLLLTGLPIPIASLVLGIIFKRKGFKCTKNIVVGIIFTLLICLSAFTGDFLVENEIDNTDTAIIRAEDIIGIELPDAETINTFYWTEEEQFNDREYIYSSTDLWLEDSQAAAFEKEISVSDKWISDIPTALRGLDSSISESDMYDYVLFYNIDTGEFNTVPKENGTYKFYFIGYQSEPKAMQINEYDIEYIK